MQLRPLRAASAFVAGLAVAFVAPVPLAAAPNRPANLHRCDRTAYVIGDSRRTLEHLVLPRTTDRVWGDQLGIRGERDGVDGTTRHVRYLAEPGVVHERFAEHLAELMAACSAPERPLVFDFMGTNYAVTHPDRAGDDAYFAEIEDTIRAFYDRSAPQARIVLAELTLDRTTGDPAYRAAVGRYLDGYNGVLRDLARSEPSRYFFLPAPDLYRDGVVWRDAAHESADLALAQYLTGTGPGALDAAGLSVIDEAHGDTCALTDDERFGANHYSEGATLSAYLQDFRAAPAAQAWLADRSVPAASRIWLAPRTDRCDDGETIAPERASDRSGASRRHR